MVQALWALWIRTTRAVFAPVAEIVYERETGDVRPLSPLSAETLPVTKATAENPEIETARVSARMRMNFLITLPPKP
jgi:hypothetical protein